jgi:hypothetical protein
MKKFKAPKLPSFGGSGGLANVNPLNFLYIGVIAIIGIVCYWIYEKFFPTPSPSDKKQDAASTAGLADYTTPEATTAATLTQLAADLSAQGLDVSVAHQSYANTLYGYLNSANVDHPAVINLIHSFGTQTFQLTAIAYGQRELPNYQSVEHMFTSAYWDSMFQGMPWLADKKILYGSLKYHLQVALSSDEFSALAPYTNTVP